jgi:uncharacterized protein YjbJ (UPF0337 family)
MQSKASEEAVPTAHFAPKPQQNHGFRVWPVACRMLVKRSTNMKDSTKDQMGGKVHELKGKIKEETGKLTNNPDLVERGQDEKVAGKVQKKVGQIEKVFEK